MSRYLQKDHFIDVLINGISLFVIIYSVYISLFMLNIERSLWLDEAALAYSFSTRDLSSLTSTAFEWTQSAPVLYLYIVKLITVFFGNSEITLRVFSFISYSLMLVAVFYISKNILLFRYPLIPTAFVSAISFLIYYSNEFKPYMTDALAVLSVIILYFLFNKGNIKARWIIVLYSILIWLSNPTCFFIGAVLIFELLEGFKNKNNRQMKFCFVCGGFVLLSFGLYFFYWLKPVIDAGGMTAYWKDYKFPLIPTSIDDLLLQKNLIKMAVSHLGLYKNLIFSVFFVGFFLNLFFIKNKYVNIIYVGFIITMFASMIGRFPFVDRLLLFIYPLMVIIFFFFLNELYSNKLSANIIVSFISIILLLTSSDSGKYLHDSNVYVKREETNHAIDYIKSNLKKEDKLYVYFHSIPGFAYKNQYNFETIGDNNTVILGKGLFEENRNQDDIQIVLDNAPIYILTSHVFDARRISPLLDSLKAHGNLRLVYDQYDTNVYFFTY